MRIRRDIEILGMQTQQHIPHTTADQKSLKSGIMQPIQYLERVFGYLVPGNRMGGTRNDSGFDFFWDPFVFQ